MILIGCTSTNFSEYKDLPGHKSIAVGSNGVIAYSSSNPNVETAITTAIDKCSLYDDRAASVDYLDKASYKVRYKCEQLTKAMAQSLFHSGHTYLDGDSDGKPCESNLWSSYYSTDTNSRKVKGTNCHYVRGYRRKNGTYVSGYTRCR
ncbi:excalibur calcium-binding domain-containing protein [Vibrio alginolyticus]|uniref:excalibur calcium-binding domain-containing protein n=1 Tax=Vibrio alginolyticus TaxID=663 RepID=UPI001C00B5D4